MQRIALFLDRTGDNTRFQRLCGLSRCQIDRPALKENIFVVIQTFVTWCSLRQG
jgi:hypothetical protein